MLDRLTGLEIFNKVASTGSLSAAGRALGMSQTMVTRHLAALEARLGVVLFHRTTRRLAITDAGRDFLDASARILAELEAAEAAVSRERLQPRGLLRVNAPVSFGTRQIAPLLADFAVRCPEIRIELGLNDRRVDLLEEGWDLAIRIGNLADSALMARRLAPSRSLLCAAPAYLAAHGTPRSVAALTEHECLLYTLSRMGAAGQWIFGARAEILVNVSGPLRANNGDALLAAAIAGQGLVYEPSFILADAIRAGQLVPLPLDHPTVPLAGIYAVYPASPHAPAKLRAFTDFLLERFRPEPPWDLGLPNDP